MEELLGQNPRDLSGILGSSNHGLELISHEVLNSLPSMTPIDLGLQEFTILGQEDLVNTSVESDIELRIEDLLNSSVTDDLMDGFKVSQPSSIEHENTTNLANPLDNSIESLEEFPLFSHPLGNQETIEGEVLLQNLDRTLYNPTQEPTSEQQPTKSKKGSSSLTNSRIPLPSLRPAIRRSRRLLVESDREVCCPKNLNIPLKSAIKKKDGMNLIVDSSSGQLHEATKFATEINAVNCEGIPIPTHPDETVTVPVQGTRKAVKNPKTALVKAYQIQLTKNTNGKDSPANIGFYSLAQYKKYCDSPSKIVKRESPKRSKVKKLRWANELEW